MDIFYTATSWAYLLLELHLFQLYRTKLLWQTIWLHSFANKPHPKLLNILPTFKDHHEIHVCTTFRHLQVKCIRKPLFCLQVINIQKPCLYIMKDRVFEVHLQKIKRKNNEKNNPCLYHKESFRRGRATQGHINMPALTTQYMSIQCQERSQSWRGRCWLPEKKTLPYKGKKFHQLSSNSVMLLCVFQKTVMSHVWKYKPLDVFENSFEWVTSLKIPQRSQPRTAVGSSKVFSWTCVTRFQQKYFHPS